MKKLLLLSAFILLALYSQAQVNLTSSLSACYGLNASGIEPINGLTGTITSCATPTLDRFNSFNSAIQFPGIAGCNVQLPNSALLKPTNAVSVSGWYKISSLGYMILVFSKNTSSSFFAAYSLLSEFTNGAYRFVAYRQNGTGSDVAVSTTSIQTNTWYHVVFCINASTMQLYVNGVLEATTIPTITSFNYDNARGVIIGGSNEVNFDLPFNGAADNVRFYTRMINASEVFSLYTTDPPCSIVQAPVASYILPSNQICLGTPLTFTDQSTNSPTAWTYSIFGSAGTYTSALQNPTINITAPGNYQVTMTASNSIGGSGTYTNAIQVRPTPTLMLNTGSTPICEGQTALLTVLGASTYSINGTQIPSTFTLTPAANASLTIVGTSAQGCTASVVFPLPVLASPTVSVLNNTVICKNSPLTLQASGAQTYAWSTGANSSSITIPAFNGTIGLVGTGANGCSANSTLTITALPLPEMALSSNSISVCKGALFTIQATGASTYSWVPAQTGPSFSLIAGSTQTVSVTGTGTNGCNSTLTSTVTVSACVGLEKENQDTFNYFPQPVSSILYLIGLEVGGRLQFYSASGQLLVNTKIESANMNVDVANYPQGLYILKIETKDRVLTKRIVKAP